MVHANHGQRFCFYSTAFTVQPLIDQAPACQRFWDLSVGDSLFPLRLSNKSRARGQGVTSAAGCGHLLFGTVTPKAPGYLGWMGLSLPCPVLIPLPFCLQNVLVLPGTIHRFSLAHSGVYKFLLGLTHRYIKILSSPSFPTPLGSSLFKSSSSSNCSQNSYAVICIAYTLRTGIPTPPTLPNSWLVTCHMSPFLQQLFQNIAISYIGTPITLQA